jgi:hypothetical protein
MYKEDICRQNMALDDNNYEVSVFHDLQDPSPTTSTRLDNF